MKANQKSTLSGSNPGRAAGGRLSVRGVVQAQEVAAFDQRLAGRHYLGNTPPAGDFLRQVVQRDGQVVGPGHCGEGGRVSFSNPNWIGLIRDHWGGVENRNHWRRDALWGEDRTRSRNPNVVANLALLRSVLTRLLNHHYPDRSHSELREAFAAKPPLRLLTQRS